MNFKKIKKQQGFTLIELMIVIAIIAILSTLGVTNFGAALRRARDAQRRSDVIELQMALETCYDIRRAEYFPTAVMDTLTAARDDLTAAKWNAMVAEMFTQGCLNRNAIMPGVAAFGYFADGALVGGVQEFLLCASLEEWTGNFAGAAAPTTERQANRPVGVLNATRAQVGADRMCNPTHENCNLFCIANAQ